MPLSDVRSMAGTGKVKNKLYGEDDRYEMSSKLGIIDLSVA